MSSWTQKKMLATVGVVTFTLSGLACGGVYYAQGQIEEVEANVTAKQLEVAAANAKIAKIPSLEREVVILREGLDEYVKILPDNSQLEEFLRMVNRFDNQSGVRGLGLQKKPAKILRRGQKQGKFTPIEYTYEMTATLWQGLRFMNLIENFERFVSITEFSIEPGESSAGVVETIEGEAVHKIKITMQTYQYNRPGKADDVEIANYDERKQEPAESLLGVFDQGDGVLRRIFPKEPPLPEEPETPQPKAEVSLAQLLRGGQRASATGDYEAWTPE